MLYFVSTPIGNLKDITLRGIEVLKDVDVIACEDTRHSLKLLNFYEIKKPLISYHKFNETLAAQKIIELLKNKKKVAVISDAGTPLISDPGEKLVNALRLENLPFTVIPGANAFVPAIILSGFNAQSFYFAGFLKGNTAKKKASLNVLKNLQSPLIFYSAPQDVDKDIVLLHTVFGDRKAAAVREITKVYEECKLFNLASGLEGEKKGEYVLVVDGAKNAPIELSETEHILYYMQKGFDKNTALKMAAKDRNVSKSELYKFSIDLK